MNINISTESSPKCFRLAYFVFSALDYIHEIPKHNGLITQHKGYVEPKEICIPYTPSLQKSKTLFYFLVFPNELGIFVVSMY